MTAQTIAEQDVPIIIPRWSDEALAACGYAIPSAPAPIDEIDAARSIITTLSDSDLRRLESEYASLSRHSVTLDLVREEIERRERAETRDRFIECDARQLVAQVGRMQLLAISGGRVIRRPTGITLPVACGYSVTIDLDVSDTYVVRRIFKRAGKEWIKGERRDVYCEDVGEVAYVASCFRNRGFGTAPEVGGTSYEAAVARREEADKADLLRADDDGMIVQEPSIVGRVGALAKVMGLGATLAVTAMVGSASARPARLTDAQAAQRLDMALRHEFPGRTVEAQCHVGQQVHCVVRVTQ